MISLTVDSRVAAPKPPKKLLRTVAETILAPSTKSMPQAMSRRLQKSLPKMVLAAETIELSFHLVGTRKIQTLNRDFRGKDRTTDVLSFPVMDFTGEGQGVMQMPIVPLGDVFVCKEAAIKQAAKFGWDVKFEIARLFLHGVVHLLGFDHELGADEARAQAAVEKAVAGALDLPFEPVP